MKRPTLSPEEMLSELDRLLRSRESGELEFKAAKGGFPGSFWETYSSFANTNGGTIVLGVKESDEVFSLNGLDEATTEKYRKDFFNMQNNRQKVSMPLVKDSEVNTLCLRGSYLMLFYVPRAGREVRPVYCGQDPYTGTFRRGNEGDYHCSPSEVSSMFADANTANPPDGRILPHYTMGDLDLASINQYRQRFQLANPDHVWNALPTEQFLRKLNVTRRDRESGAEGLTVAGLLMFGTYSAINDYNPNFFLDYKEIESADTRWVNRICPDGNWESNLFQFYQRVLPILQSFLPKPFRLEGNQRINETQAHVAIREALTNTLVHSDYTVNASLCVYKYPNRIVFSNPGTMLIPVRQYYMGGESVCRNKYLQTLFTFLGFADKAGSGADKIIKGWTAQNWRRPYIEECFQPNKVVLTLTMESLFDERLKERLSQMLGRRVVELRHEQFTALALAFSEGEVSNDRLQSVLDMHRSDITQLLGDLCAAGFLVGVGYGRGRKYHLPEANGASSEANATGRYNVLEMRNMVMECCSEWSSLDEIADFVGRSKKHLRTNVLPKMMDVLEMMYKDNPTHPRQKYKRKS